MSMYYSQLGNFLVELRRRRDNANDRSAINAWKRIIKDVPSTSGTSISEDNTTDIITTFAENAGDLAASTVRNYSQAFTNAVRRFLEYVELTGAADLSGMTEYLQETDPELEEAMPAHTTEPDTDDEFEEGEDYVKKPTVKTYTFLLRPGLDMKVSIPDDITANEVKRLSTWLGTYVVSAR